MDWEGEIDVTRFTTSVAAGDWDTAVQLYTGELLAGLHIGDSNPFEEWLHEQREQLRQQMLQTLGALTNQQLAQSNITAAEATIRRHLSLDAWNEELWRQLMSLLAQDGRTPQALATYQECTQVLRTDLDLSPSPETDKLFKAIRDGRFPDEKTATSGNATAQTASPSAGPTNFAGNHAKRVDRSCPT